MRTAPGFTDALRRAAEAWSRIDPGLKGETGRLLRNMDRFAAAAWLAWLETTPGGLTVGRLHALTRAVGAGGVGLARAAIAYLRFIRYLEPEPRSCDGRIQRYRSTPAVRLAFRERLRQELEIGRNLDPAIPALLARLHEDPVFERYLAVIAETSIAMIQSAPRRDNPVTLFWRRNSGMHVLAELLKRGEPGDAFPPRGPLAYSVKDLARCCDTSRMQVQSLLNLVRDAGLLVRLPDGRDRLSEDLREGFEKLLASAVLMQAGAARIVLG